jgi:hypothetical protein
MEFPQQLPSSSLLASAVHLQDCQLITFLMEWAVSSAPSFAGSPRSAASRLISIILYWNNGSINTSFSQSNLREDNFTFLIFSLSFFLAYQKKFTIKVLSIDYEHTPFLTFEPPLQVF